MGMYDTVTLSPPLYCSYCGRQHDEFQTYSLGKKLRFYKIGDRLESYPYDTKFDGNVIIQNLIYCCGDCVKLKEDFLGADIVDFWYIVFKNYIYVGTASTLDHAEYLLDTEHYQYERY